MRYSIFIFLFILAIKSGAQQQYKLLQKSGHNISNISFSPNGKLIATGGTEYTIIWDVEKGLPLHTLKGHKDIVLATAFSPDGSILATASRDKTIILWSTHEGLEIKRLTLHTGAVTSVKFSKDGKFLLSGSTDKTAIVWDINSNKPLSILKGHAKDVTSVTITPDETHFATGSLDGEIKLWNAKTFELVRSIKTNAGEVRCLAAMNHNSSYIAAGFQDKTVKLIALSSGEIFKTYTGHKDVVYDIEFSSDDSHIASGGLDNIVKVWDVDAETSALLSLSKFYNFISLSISPDGKTLATAELNTQLKLWDISSLNIGSKKPTSGIKLALKTGSNSNGPKPSITVVQPKVDRSVKFIWHEKEINIKGEVQSEHGIYELLINGEEVPLTNKSFSHSVKLAYRDNTITIRATDTKGNFSEESFVIERQVATAFDTAKRQGIDYALVIATNDYDHYGKLVNPINDGETIAKELTENYGFKTEIVRNPTRAEFYSALRRYSKKAYNDDDQLFIFIAGHGEFDDVYTEGFIVTKDSKKNDEVKESFISHSNLRTFINNIPCKHILLTLDVCFGGTFDQFVASERGTEQYKEISTDKFIKKKLEIITRRYLTSGGKEYVPDGRPGQHSPFARKFIDALRSYGGNDGLLTFNELYSHVEKCVPGPKTGEFGNNQPGSDFLFIYKK